MKKRIVLGSIITTLLFCSGCSGNLYESNANGYTQVKSVDGVYFDMADSWLEQATAITHISEENDYSVGTYLYKNGESSYLLFNIDSIIVCVDNGSSYNFESTDSMAETLESTSLDGIWFTSTDDKKLDYEESSKNGTYKMIASVNAAVSVTSELYGDFSGKLACIETGDYECSLFVGARAENYDDLSKNQKKLINHIVKSLTISDEEILSAGETEENTEASSDNITVVEPTEESEDTEIIEDTEEDVTITDENISTETEDDSLEATEIPVETEEITIEQDTEDSNVNSEATTEEAQSSADNFTALENNQSESTDTFSDIYHMLSIGATGTFQALNNTGDQFEAENITIENLYTGADAINIIKEYCNSKECPYKYEDAPAGTSWHCIEYTIDRQPTDLYANIKILGLDGELLKHRGVSYTSRTHDIFYKMTSSDGRYSKMYCYYAVPNGCKEYMLQVGDYIEDANTTAACYYINNY